MAGDFRMVRVLTAANAAQARLIAARLGSEGIVWQLRGAVDGPLPVGPVEVLVEDNDIEAAKELLLADQVEEAPDGWDADAVRFGVLTIGLAIVLAALFVVARMQQL